MATDKATRSKARFLIMSILKETRDAIVHLNRNKTAIFDGDLEGVVLNEQLVDDIQDKLKEAMRLVSSDRELDWEALEQVGLTGATP